MVRSSDAGAAVMRFIKRKTENDSEEFFSMDEEDSAGDKTGS